MLGHVYRLLSNLIMKRTRGRTEGLRVGNLSKELQLNFNVVLFVSVYFMMATVDGLVLSRA